MLLTRMADPVDAWAYPWVGQEVELAVLRFAVPTFCCCAGAKVSKLAVEDQCPDELLLREIWSRYLWRMAGVLCRATGATPSCTAGMGPMHTRMLHYITITTDCSTLHFYQLKLFSMIPDSCSFSSSWLSLERPGARFSTRLCGRAPMTSCTISTVLINVK